MRERGLLVVVATTVLLASLDFSVIFVALPKIRASLSATVQETVWLTTFFIFALVIATVLTGFLTSRFGRRRMMIGSITAFVLASWGCGAATSLEMLLVFRVLQGASAYEAWM